MTFLRQVWDLVGSWLRPSRYTTILSAELPEHPNARTVYLLGEGEYRWFVVLLCPCGCGALLQLSLLDEAIPRWTLNEHGDGTVSLCPSVWRTTGCRSHFFVRRSRVVWC